MNKYYISPTGSDGNSGTYLSPWLTLAHAYANSVSGDTIYLMDGTHTWANTLVSNRAVMALNQGKAIIDAGGTYKYLQPESGSGDYLTLFGIIFQNLDCSADYNPFGFQASYQTLTMNNCIFRSNIYSGGYASAGLISNAGANDCILNMNNCTIDDPLLSGSLAIYYNYLFVFARNITVNINGLTVSLRDTSSSAPQNIFHEQSYAAVLNVKNSIFVGNGVSRVNFTATDGGGTIDTTGVDAHNCIYNVSSAPTVNVTSDPLFKDAANGNFVPRNPLCVNGGVL